jgi:putative membrane protein
VSGLNDAQIAAVILTLNGGELAEAQLAQSKAMGKDVRQLADRMAAEHKLEKSREHAILQHAQITPSDNAVSMQMKNDSQQNLTNLQNARGRDFDREYVEVLIKGHNQAIDLVDRILPNVKNPELKTDVQALRGKLEQHLRESEKVQRKMQTGTTAPQPKGTARPKEPSAPKTP